eukprot:2962697-Rhodomonas_salina.6
MSGTDGAYGATSGPAYAPLPAPRRSARTVRSNPLRACYAMSGTDLAKGVSAYATMRCPVLTYSV